MMTMHSLQSSSCGKKSASSGLNYPYAGRRYRAFHVYGENLDVRYRTSQNASTPNASLGVFRRDRSNDRKYVHTRSFAVQRKNQNILLPQKSRMRADSTDKNFSRLTAFPRTKLSLPRCPLDSGVRENRNTVFSWLADMPESLKLYGMGLVLGIALALGLLYASAQSGNYHNEFGSSTQSIMVVQQSIAMAEVSVDE